MYTAFPCDKMVCMKTGRGSLAHAMPLPLVLYRKSFILEFVLHITMLKGENDKLSS